VPCAIRASRHAPPSARVHPSFLLARSTGAYAGFDKTAPTSADGGKAVAVRSIQARLRAGGSGSAASGGDAAAPLVVIGDGVTDMQARPPADAFIGYGGVVVRAAVEQGADWFVRDWAEVLAVVKGVDAP
jgi:phosphoserine phosphatase